MVMGRAARSTSLKNCFGIIGVLSYADLLEFGIAKKKVRVSTFSVRMGYRRDAGTQVLSMSLRSMISDNVGDQNGHGRFGY